MPFDGPRIDLRTASPCPCGNHVAGRTPRPASAAVRHAVVAPMPRPGCCATGVVDTTCTSTRVRSVRCNAPRTPGSASVSGRSGRPSRGMDAACEPTGTYSRRAFRTFRRLSRCHGNASARAAGMCAQRRHTRACGRLTAQAAGQTRCSGAEQQLVRRGIDFVHEVDGQARVPDRGRIATPVAAVVEHPLGVFAEQRELQRARERQREPARPGLQYVDGPARPRARAPRARERRRPAAPPPRAAAPTRCAGTPTRGPSAPRGPSAGRCAQRVERQHVGRALPDRQHLRVAQQPRQAGVLDVARRRRSSRSTSVTTATACLPVASFASGVSRRSSARLLVVDLARFLAAEQLDQQEREQERAPGLRLEHRRACRRAAALRERRAEGHALRPRSRARARARGA